MFICVLVKQQYLLNQSFWTTKTNRSIRVQEISKSPALPEEKNMTALVHFPPQNKQLNWSISYHTPDLLPLIPCVGHKKSDMVSNVKLTCFFFYKKNYFKYWKLYILRKYFCDESSNINHVLLFYIDFNLSRIKLEKDRPGRILERPIFAIGTEVTKLSS